MINVLSNDSRRAAAYFYVKIRSIAALACRKKRKDENLPRVTLLPFIALLVLSRFGAVVLLLSLPLLGGGGFISFIEASHDWIWNIFDSESIAHVEYYVKNMQMRGSATGFYVNFNWVVVIICNLIAGTFGTAKEYTRINTHCMCVRVCVLADV